MEGLIHEGLIFGILRQPTFPLAQLLMADNNSEFTQEDGKKKRTAKGLCVTNVTGLSLACFVVIFTEH